MHHLASGIISGISAVLCIQYAHGHFVSIRIYFCFEPVTYFLMLHVLIIAMNIYLHYISLVPVFAEIIPHILFNQFSGKICTFSCLAGTVRIYEASYHLRIQGIIINAALIYPVLIWDAQGFPFLRVCDDLLSWLSMFPGTVL